ncbi:DNA repair exonuclease SbcCD ATPase subunit [Massilia sp. MP_M2]|uniref:DNA-binding protein n=1 Tax=Massilia sp. MP_M2 TaxID=3071713 RepID=UPI00319EAAA7
MIDVEIRARCNAHPDFAGGTAYSRAKICCRVLTELGQAIPSWMVIREIIEKGSSNDISRGVKEFRAEHAEQLRQMGGAIAGLPPQLAPLVRGFWEAAVAAARELHAKDVTECQAKVDAAETRAALADQEAERARADVTHAHGQIETLRAQLAADADVRAQLKQQLESERELRRYAEQMREDSALELAQQRQRLEETLAQSQAAMAQALERFDGERKHTLLQIEQARTNADREVRDIRDHAIRAEAELRKKLDDISQNNSTLRSQFEVHHSRIGKLTQERDDLNATVARLEQQNRSMVELVRKAKPGSAKPRGLRKLRSALRKNIINVD